jgi:quercetin dioxygenase-like cupin family protein
MNKGRFLLFFTLSILPAIVSAQVLVRLEPRHKNVLENKYLRLLDVHIAPGDTSLFHIHSTPSFFLILTSNKVGVQIKGQDWTKSQNIAGESWYQSFLNDTLIHRVTNCDTVPFHVTDIELLAPYHNGRQIKPLPFKVLLENEKVLAYVISNSSIDQKVISKRGPIIAQLVDGDKILAHDVKTKKTKEIKKGSYLYIRPGSSFYFTAPVDEKIILILLEIK